VFRQAAAPVSIHCGEFSSDIRHTPGVKNHVADALSRPSSVVPLCPVASVAPTFSCSRYIIEFKKWNGKIIPVTFFFIVFYSGMDASHLEI
jgi:hypothetical protein